MKPTLISMALTCAILSCIAVAIVIVVRAYNPPITNKLPATELIVELRWADPCNPVVNVRREYALAAGVPYKPDPRCTDGTAFKGERRATRLPVVNDRKIVTLQTCYDLSESAAQQLEEQWWGYEVVRVDCKVVVPRNDPKLVDVTPPKKGYLDIRFVKPLEDWRR